MAVFVGRGLDVVGVGSFAGRGLDVVGVASFVGRGDGVVTVELRHEWPAKKADALNCPSPMSRTIVTDVIASRRTRHRPSSPTVLPLSPVQVPH